MMLTTAWHSPYALIRRGGVAAGKRPCTRLAWITRAVAKDGHIIKLKVRMVDQNWRPVTLERDADQADVVQQWRNRPTSKAIARAKKRLPVEPLPDAPRATRRAA